MSHNPYKPPIEHSLPDLDTYTIIINERQRALMMKAMNYMIMSLQNTQWLDADEEHMANSLRDMLNPAGSTGPLAPSPAVNGFVL